MRRPVGVTILAALCFLGGAGAIVATMLWEELSLSSLMEAVPAVALPFGSGIGLWKLREWGRQLCIFGTAAGIILAPIPIIVSLGSIWLSPIPLLIYLFAWGFSGWVLWYLLRPNVKKAFVPPGFL